MKEGGGGRGRRECGEREGGRERDERMGRVGGWEEGWEGIGTG